MKQGVIATAVLALLASFSNAAQWETVESGVDSALYCVTNTAAGYFACGGEGIVLNRTESGNWEKILQGGPTGNANSLYACTSTDDGERLWFAGVSGAIGEMDVFTGTVTDHSGPDDSGDNMKTIQAKGPENDANIYVGSDSGLWFYNFDDGASGKWNYETPGSGSSIKGASMYGVTEGHIVDGNSDCFITMDGVTFDKIGIPDADSTPYDVDSNGRTAVWASGGGGLVYRYDGANWNDTRVDPNSDATLNAIKINSANTDGYTAGSGGAVFRLVDGTGAGTWERESTATGSNLNDVDFDSDLAVAVGASGTIIEKQ